MMKMVENVNVGPWLLKSPLLDLDRNDKIRPKQTFHKTLWIPDCGLGFNKNFYGSQSAPILAIVATNCDVCFLNLKMLGRATGRGGRSPTQTLLCIYSNRF